MRITAVRNYNINDKNNQNIQSVTSIQTNRYLNKIYASKLTIKPFEKKIFYRDSTQRNFTQTISSHRFRLN